MGDPRYETDAPYNVGNCAAGGVCYCPKPGSDASLADSKIQFDARPAGQTCGAYNSKIQSYCDVRPLIISTFSICDVPLT